MASKKYDLKVQMSSEIHRGRAVEPHSRKVHE